MWRFLKDFFIYGFTSILGKIAAIFLIPIYTNILTKEEYGAMALIISCYGVIDIAANLNIHSGIARDYYEKDIDRIKLVSTGFFSILSLSIITTLVLLCFNSPIYYDILNLNDEYYMSFIVMLLTIPVTCLHTYFAILTRYKKKPVQFSVGTLISLAISIGITIYGVVFLRIGIISYFIASLISGFLSSLYYYNINKNLIALSFRPIYLKRALAFSLPTLPAILAGWIDTSLGQLLIGKFVSLSSLGVYSIAISLCSVFTLITTAFMNVWSPFLYENYKKDSFNHIIKQLFIIISVSLIIISATLSVFSKEIIFLLTNPGYIDASKYITLLCIPMCFYLLFPFASSGVSIYRETKHIGTSYVFGSIINLSILLLSIKSLGVIAVPICLALSRIFTYFYLYSKSQKRINYQLPNLTLIALIIIQVISYGFLDAKLTIKILYLLLIYITILIYFLKHVSYREIYDSFISKLKK